MVAWPSPFTLERPTSRCSNGVIPRIDSAFAASGKCSLQMPRNGVREAARNCINETVQYLLAKNTPSRLEIVPPKVPLLGDIRRYTAILGGILGLRLDGDFSL